MEKKNTEKRNYSKPSGHNAYTKKDSSKSNSSNRDSKSRGKDNGPSTYKPRRDNSKERNFKPRKYNSEERTFKPRKYNSEERSYTSRRDNSEERNFKPRRNGSSTIKPYRKSYENDRPYERKPYIKKNLSSKNYRNNDTEPIKNESPSDEIRLNKFIANSGICSRREADQYIQNGNVTVNGVIVTELGTKIKPTDEVKFDGQRLKGEKRVYILMNKPKDYVTTLSDPHAEHTVMDLIDKADCPQRIYPVGRLDKSTTGVLLLTNDGELTKQLTHPSFGAKKVYEVTLNDKLKKDDMDAILNGIELEDGEIHADAISYVENDKSTIGIEIHSGRNRIVRRIFESLGYNVKKLDRVMFAGLTKKSLRRGEWRYLTNQEVSILKMGGF